MKNIFSPALALLMSAGCLTLLSCQKTEILDDPAATITASAVGTTSKKSGGGGGGNSGGGHNGGSNDGGTTTTATPPLAPTDTTTSQLPIASIITVGKWRVTSFVQGKDNNTSKFAKYAFTFNTNGTMIANDGSQTTGNWRYQDAVFYYGIPAYGSSNYGFTMTIGTAAPLTLLNENYFISKKTLTTVYIDSINPAENAHITLSKLAQ